MFADIKVSAGDNRTRNDDDRRCGQPAAPIGGAADRYTMATVYLLGFEVPEHLDPFHRFDKIGHQARALGYDNFATGLNLGDHQKLGFIFSQHKVFNENGLVATGTGGGFGVASDGKLMTAQVATYLARAGELGAAAGQHPAQ